MMPQSRGGAVVRWISLPRWCQQYWQCYRWFSINRGRCIHTPLAWRCEANEGLYVGRVRENEKGEAVDVLWVDLDVHIRVDKVKLGKKYRD